MSSVEERLPRVLVVDDKTNMARLMKKVLRPEASVRIAGGGEEALRILEAESVDVVLSDLRMPDLDGIELLKRCKQVQPAVEFILMTAFASLPTAIEALRLGAYDYLTKPFEPEEVRAVVFAAMDRRAASLPRAAAEVSEVEVLPGLFARSESMKELASLVRRIAASDATALLLGETGTGKELVARAIHRFSRRSSRRFVAVNCAAIPVDLLESELFGYVKGAFSGATNDRSGLFEEADGGTLFLDEIAEMRLSLQAKLTRALEERAIRRIGDSHERSVDTRIIAATHRDIETMAAGEGFRQDLWYRLNVTVVRIPPLRERREDIELLATHFLRERASVYGRRIHGFSDSALEAMGSYDWPGNVRQLQAAVERGSVVTTGDRVDAEDLPPEVLGSPRRESDISKLLELPWAEAADQGREIVARHYIEGVLRRYGGRVVEAAAHAGVERESFYRLIRRFGVDSSTHRQ